MESSQANVPRIMFVYWGRRGFARFALDLGRAALACPTVDPCISVSRQNEGFQAFEGLGACVFPVDTFHTMLGPLTQAWRMPIVQREFAKRLKRDRIEAVVNLMPHIWSPFLYPAIRRAGVRYSCILHDADPHPSDWTAPVEMLSDSTVAKADRALTLSRTVAERLCATGRLAPSRVASLFSPDLSYAQGPMPRRREPGAPLRLLFLGRIMPYKGLLLFVKAVESLRAEGLATVGRLVAKKGTEFLLRTLARLRVRCPELPLELIIIGAGPRAGALKHLCGELSLNDALRFLGACPHAAVRTMVKRRRTGTPFQEAPEDAG